MKLFTFLQIDSDCDEWTYYYGEVGDAPGLLSKKDIKKYILGDVVPGIDSV